MNASSVPFFSPLIHATRIGAAIWNHPANRGQRLSGILRFLSWQFTKHVLKRPRVISFHAKLLKCYPDSTSTSAALYFAGYADYREMKFLQAYLREGDNVLDIGANVGVYTLLACAYIGTTGSVDAFEPVERVAARIEEQAVLNGLKNVRVHRLAVSDEDGKRAFGFSGEDAMAHLQRSGEDTSHAAEVQTIKLDSFAPYVRYSVGKMDIEGAEPLAFAGATSRLAECNPPVWLIELAGLSNAYGRTTDQVMQQLADAGYDCAVFDPDSGQLQYTQTPWLLGVHNVLAISRTERIAVGKRLQESRDPIR
jgi:FkbM family methyltransferase